MSKLERIQQMALRLAGEIARMQNEFKMELLFDAELQAEMAAMRRTLADLAKQGVRVAGRECSVRIRFGSPAWFVWNGIKALAAVLALWAFVVLSRKMGVNLRASGNVGNMSTKRCLEK